ncbi:MAG TPA: GNAT family N-acyltransferase [Gammaproteobacteria bacterium]
MSTYIARREDVGNVAETLREAVAPELTVSIAFSPEEVRESQRLRYAVFAEEMGARLETPEPGLDIDDYDPWCQHVIVRDRLTRAVVASTRVLVDRDARLAGGFYSETEFDIGRLLRSPGRVMEIGRTCVHPDYRSGSAITLLWSGLARFLDVNKFRYMIGCASIPMGECGANALAAYEMLREKYLLAEALRATPRLPLPERVAPASERQHKPVLPPLLKAYIRLGARIGGEPCWDPLFDCADLFIVLSPSELQKRYAKHFLVR